jgi:hypothetical protein
MAEISHASKMSAKANGQHGASHSVQVGHEDEHEAVVAALSRNKAIHYDVCKAAADYLMARTYKRPTIAIICGTGLGKKYLPKAIVFHI